MKYGDWAPLSGRPPAPEPGAETAVVAAATEEYAFLGFSLAQVLMDLPDGRNGIWLQGWARSSSSGSGAEVEAGLQGVGGLLFAPLWLV